MTTGFGTGARVLVIAVAVSTVACAGARPAGVTPPSPFPRAPRPPAAASPDPFPAARTYAGSVANASGGDALVQTALSLLGVAYRYGGDDPSIGLDCSGLVWWVFGQHRIDVPRTVDQQFGAGQRIDGATLEAGDLIFFTTTAPGATHVGIALGPGSPGEFVHAPASNGVVRVERYDSSYWRDRIVGYRRVMPAPGRAPVTAPSD